MLLFQLAPCLYFCATQVLHVERCNCILAEAVASAVSDQSSDIPAALGLTRMSKPPLGSLACSAVRTANAAPSAPTSSWQWYCVLFAELEDCVVTVRGAHGSYDIDTSATLGSKAT
jgi:hypothetical protein